MENKTKIVLLKTKELIYTGIFVVLGILLLFLLLHMFTGKHGKQSSAKASYEPGTYTSPITIGDATFEVLVTVSKDRIENVAFDQLNETVATMYPLLNTALDKINEQVKEVDSLNEIAFETDYQYTGTVIKQAMEQALKKAEK